MEENISRNCIEMCRVSTYYVRMNEEKENNKKLGEIWSSYKHLEEIKKKKITIQNVQC